MLYVTKCWDGQFSSSEFGRYSDSDGTSQELGCPIETAIASFLDAEAFSFEDCLLSKREPRKIA